MFVTFIGFRQPSITGAVFAQLVEDHDLGFEPVRIKSRAFRGAFNEKNLNRVRRIERGWIVAASRDDDEAVFRVVGPSYAQRLVWMTEAWPNEELIEEVAQLPGFMTALIGDHDDVFWQSTNRVQTYRVAGQPWEHLPVTPGKFPFEDLIDISGNPGRRERGPSMDLWAAAKMWFGSDVFELLDRDRLFDLPVGEVTERDDLVIVELFDPDDPIEHIRDRQTRYRDWMGYDDLDERISELNRKWIDPDFEVITLIPVGSDGPVRQTIHWYRDGEPAPRSQADKKHVRDYDRNGKVISSKIHDVT